MKNRLAMAGISAAILLLCPIFANAGVIINHDQQGTSGDFTITGHDFATGFDVKLHDPKYVSYILFGAPNGADASDLTRPSAATPAGNGTSTYSSSGSTTLAALRTALAVPSAQEDNLLFFIDANQDQARDHTAGTLNINEFKIEILNSLNNVVKSWAFTNLTDNTPVTLQDQYGASRADYLFAVTAGMGLNSYPGADTIRFSLNMDHLTAGRDVVWAVPEPSTLILLGTCGLGLVCGWRRRRSAA